jgi:hypothetical protein
MFPGDNTPQQIVSTAERYLDQHLDRAVVKRTIADYSGWLENLLLTYEEHGSAIEVGSCALQVLHLAYRDYAFNPDNINVLLAEGNIDPDELDPAYFAAAAYAEGTVWDEGSDPSKRWAFWRWWLDEAVPLAWGSVPE